MTSQARAYKILALNTLAFTVCFAAWVIYGVLITFLVISGVYQWDKAQMGLLIAVPVLTGAILRLPMGVLTDKYGGRIVYALLILISAVPMYLVSYANTYLEFLLGGLGFGLSGASFAVGIAYTAIWFRKEQQGTALGIFGMGNIGTAVTSAAAPFVLSVLTDYGANVEGWRILPKLYAAGLAITAVVFFLLADSKRAEGGQERSFLERLAPLRYLRVWRFGLYYSFFFGGFVALSQWLIPYYVNVYSMGIGAAGLMATLFSLPTGLARGFGGWLSDRWGARNVMYLVLCASATCLLLLIAPRMEIYSPGEGIMADRPGMVSAVSTSEIVVGSLSYPLLPRSVTEGLDRKEEGMLVLPTVSFWHEPAVQVGQRVQRQELLAKGVTHIYFQANMWVFTILLLLAGLMMGMGMAAVYKHIPDYFPREVGVVGGMVGVLGGLGGFFAPIIFGSLLKITGIWTTTWMFLAVLALVCLLWMHLVIQRMMRQKVPVLIRQIEDRSEAESAVVRGEAQRHPAPAERQSLGEARLGRSMPTGSS